MRRAFTWPFNSPGLLAALAAALVVSGFGFFGVGVIGIAVTLAFLFQIVRHTAQGQDDLPGPEEFRGLLEDVISPLFRSALALFWVVVPALLWLYWQRETQGLAVPILLMTIGLLLMPMSLLVSALGTPISTVANPVYLVGYALRLGVDYLLAVLFFTVCCALGALFLAFDKQTLSAIPLHGLLTNVVEVLFALSAFRGIGLLVRARGAELGYGLSNDYLVPLLPDTAPRLNFDPAKSVTVGTTQATLERSFEPIELPPAAAPAPAIEEDGNLALLRCLAREDATGCFLILERSGSKIRANLLSAQAWLELGKKAAQASSAKAAAVAFKRCLDIAPEGPLAPGAWLLAARVYAELLADLATSERLQNELLQRFPDSMEAQSLTKKLAADPGPVNS